MPRVGADSRVCPKRKGRSLPEQSRERWHRKMCRCSFSLFCPQIVIFTIYGLTIDVFFAHRLHRLTQIFVVFVISGVFGIKTKCRCSFSLLFYCMRVVGMTSERSKLQRSAQRDACVACRSKKSRSTDLGIECLVRGCRLRRCRTKLYLYAVTTPYDDATFH